MHLPGEPHALPPSKHLHAEPLDGIRTVIDCMGSAITETGQLMDASRGLNYYPEGVKMTPFTGDQLTL